MKKVNNTKYVIYNLYSMSKSFICIFFKESVLIN